MKLLTALLIAAWTMSLGACDGPGRPRDGGVIDAGADATGFDAAGFDAGGLDAAGLDAAGLDAGVGFDASTGLDAGIDAGPLTRGMAWVRSHPMFISGLTVDMGPPPAEFVRAYHEDFHANAAHLWATAMPAEVAGWSAVGPPGFRFVAWLNPDGTSAANPAAGVLGGAGGPMAGRIGYQIGDEPGLSCAADVACAVADMSRMEVGVNAVRARDPDALLFLNFADLDTTEALLAAYAAYDVDVISYDAYHRGINAYEPMELVRAAGLAQGRPYWRYMRSFGFDTGSSGVTASDARWDAYSGLVYGYTGHTWFLYTINQNDQLQPFLFAAENDFNAARTPLFAEVAAVNQVLARVGPIMTQLTSTDVRYNPSVALLQPPGTRPWSVGAGGNPYLSAVEVAETGVDLSLGFFVDARGEQIVIVQNVSHTHGSFPTSHEGNATVTLRFDFAGAAGVNRDALRGLNLGSGLSTSVPLAGSGDLRSVVFTIAAGDIALFMIDRGNDFLRGPS